MGTLVVDDEQKDFELACNKSCRDSWSDPPHDIMELIMRPFPFIDRYNMARVCKHWRSTIRSIVPHNELRYGSPCLASIDEEATGINLFDPFFKMTHTIRIPGLSGAIIRSSKEGWLLISQDRHQGDGMRMFFLNPLTRARIELPHLNLYTGDVFSFSGSPSSPTCMVFILLLCGSNLETIRLMSCKRGDKQWKERVVTHNIPLMGPLTNLICHSQCFYYLSEGGDLRGFNAEDDTWTVLKLPEWFKDSAYNAYLVDLNEDLTLVFKRRLGGSVEAFRVDTCKNQLVPLTSLGDQTLFVCEWGSLSTRAPTESMKNMIFFNIVEGEKCVNYSLEVGSMTDLNGIKLLPLSVWIDLQWCQASPGVLRWHE